MESVVVMTPGFCLRFLRLSLVFLADSADSFTGSHFSRDFGSNVGSHPDGVADAPELP